MISMNNLSGKYAEERWSDSSNLIHYGNPDWARVTCGHQAKTASRYLR